jgi:hypothetical protein
LKAGKTALALGKKEALKYFTDIKDTMKRLQRLSVDV